jgi:GNAT superfamily N-acetyltransferase
MRRGRRADFVPVMEVLVKSGLPVPAADRAVLRRFRKLVSDPGSDLYVAVVDERIVGFVHVSYSRQLGTPQRARIESLVVLPELRGGDVESSLMTFALERARKRGCHSLDCTAGEAGPPMLSANQGQWSRAGDALFVDLSAFER